MEDALGAPQCALPRGLMKVTVLIHACTQQTLFRVPALQVILRMQESESERRARRSRGQSLNPSFFLLRFRNWVVWRGSLF